MFKDILRLTWRIFLRIMGALLPVGLLVGVVRYFDLTVMQTMGLMIPVVAYEAWLIFKRLLPGMGDLVTKTLYSANITTDEETVLQDARRLLAAGNAQGALNMLEEYRNANRKMVRAWLMESGMLNDLHRYSDSVKLLESGLKSRRWRKEDRALFLYKIGAVYDSYLGDPHQARQYWQRAADKYPRTAYGRAAWEKL